MQTISDSFLYTLISDRMTLKSGKLKKVPSRGRSQSITLTFLQGRIAIINVVMIMGLELARVAKGLCNLSMKMLLYLSQIVTISQPL